jgi:hypothetical protein
MKNHNPRRLELFADGAVASRPRSKPSTSAEAELQNNLDAARARLHEIVAEARGPDALQHAEALSRGSADEDRSGISRPAKGNRHGHRAAAMVLLTFRHGLRACELVGLE